MGACGVVLAAAASAKVRQMRRFVDRLTTYASFTPQSLVGTLTSATTAYLTVLGDVNRVFGLALLLFTLINLPLNALLIMMLLFGQVLQKSMKVIVCLFVAAQLGFTFAITFFSAVLAIRLHQPVRRCLSLTAKGMGLQWVGVKVVVVLGEKDQSLGNNNRRRGQWRCLWTLPHRLKLLRYIEAFHSDRQFTVNYGSYGPISFQSLGKVNRI